MATTPRWLLPEIATGQAAKETRHNSALRILDAVVQLAVVDQVSSAPTSPANGAAYIMTGQGGAWSTFAINNIGYYVSGNGWIQIQPSPGAQAWDRGEKALYVYTSTSSWLRNSLFSSDVFGVQPASTVPMYVNASTIQFVSLA